MTQAKGVNGVLGFKYKDESPNDLTKIYFESEGFKASRNLSTSNVMTGNRQNSAPAPGNIDVTGSISTELQAYIGGLFYAAAGSVKTSVSVSTGEVLGSALASPSMTISPQTQTAFVSSVAHGLAVGDTVQIAGLTAPTSLNNTYCRVITVTHANSFVLRIHSGVTTTTFTLGSGTLKKVTTPGAAYYHVFDLGGILPALKIEKGADDIAQYMLYDNCKCGKFSLSATPEGFQKISFDFMGVSETLGTSSIDSTVTDLGKQSFNGSHLLSPTIGVLGLRYNVTKLDINIENSLDGSAYAFGGAGLRFNVSEGTCKVTGTLEAIFENRDEYDLAVNDTETTLFFTYSIGSGDGSPGNEWIQIYLPKVRFKQDTPTISGDKGLLVTLPFECYFVPSSGLPLAQIQLKNSQLSI